jgi:chitodextrinase
MMRKKIGFALLMALAFVKSYGQVDTTLIYNNSMPYGSLDIRIAKSATQYYYLQDNVTFSFRESQPGVKTNKYRDMTAWDSSPYKQANLREKNGSGDKFVLNFRYLVPQNYNPSYSPGYPLIVMFHGLGERGNCWNRECYHADATYLPVTNTPPAPTDSASQLLNNDHQLSTGGAVHLKASNTAAGKLPNDPTLAPRAYPGFIIAPQNLNGWDVSTAEDVIRIVRLMSKKYNIDENRIYIHGLSNGGHGVFETIKRAPWLFAAALTMSAINDGNINGQNLASTVSHIPMWMFQGGMDQNPTPQKTENFVKRFRDAGAEVRYTLYPNLGHGTWGTAYNEPDFFTWMLGKNRADIHVFAGNPTICGTSLELQLPKGFYAYQWQLNGQTIPGASEATYSATAAGKYRARFSRVPNPTENQWNNWSPEVTVTMGQGLPQPVITQKGTVLLRDLNDYPNARLEVKEEYSHYYWYKNGNLIDFPGEQDDTIQHALITPSMGKGMYTVVVSNFANCKSAPSAAKSLFFNNEAPANITAPADLRGTVNGPEITVSWNDASANENGFEVWRRRKLDGTNYTPWEMATLTNANVTSFQDKGLAPLSVYQYKVRAVSTTGRSVYTPNDGTVELTSGVDQTPPTAPQGLVVIPFAVSKMRLSWVASTDNSAVKNYMIYYGTDSVATTGIDTTYVINGLPVNQIFHFTVRAVDVAGNYSAPSNSRQASTYMSGLFYQHSTGAVETLDSIDWSTPEFTGMIQTFSLSPKTQDDYFNFRFDGYLLITKAGSYQFRTGSDDGSRLSLNNKLIVENNGVHNLKVVTSAAQSLGTGPQRITVDFFDYIESDSLAVSYMGPDTDNKWVPVTINVLKSDVTVVTVIDDEQGPEDTFRISVYPNPSTAENINVQVQSVSPLPVRIQMIDPVGRRLSAGVFEMDQAAEGVRLESRERLSEGVYILMATQGDTTIRQRVLIKN